MRNHYIGITILGILSLIVCFMGFIISGPPVSQESIHLDETRINDFSNIKLAIEDYYRINNKQLPPSTYHLSDLKFTYTTTEPKDPESKKSYEYQKITSTDYKLCATFSTEPDPTYTQGSGNSHKKGYDCIKYEIPSYLYTYVTPTPAQAIVSLKDSLVFTKPKFGETLCKGSDYKIEWEVGSDATLINMSIDSKEVGHSYFNPSGYTSAGVIPDNSDSNSKKKGSFNWSVGSLYSGTQLPSHSESNRIITTVYFPNNVQKDYYSDYFTISDCSNSQKTPAAP